MNRSTTYRHRRGAIKSVSLTILIWMWCSLSVTAQSAFDSLFQVIKTAEDPTAPFASAIQYLASSIYQNPDLIRKKSEKLVTFFSNKDALLSAKAMRIHAMTYYVQEDYDKALDLLLPLVDIMKESGSPSDLGIIYESMALAYRPRGELATMESYSKEAIRLFEQGKDSVQLASAANNLAIHYMQENQNEEAEYYFERAITFFRQKKMKAQLSFALLNQGSMEVRRDNNIAGKAYIRECIPLLEAGQNKLALSMAYTALGNADFNLGQLEEAEQNLLKGYSLASDYNHSQQISIAAEILSRLYEANGDYQSAYRYYREWGVKQDSFQSAEQDAQLVDALQKYESEKKQQEIELLSIKNKVANRNSMLALIFALGITAIAYMIYRNRNKMKSMNKILETQKEAISKNLEEKDFLLKEIHHRVKNNLQVISSLLKLQAKSIDDTQAKKALNDGRTRVRSMSLIHQNLYQKDQLAGIKMDEYIPQLVEELVETYRIDQSKLEINLHVEDLILDVESVVPIGLIINELVSNVLKYAFANQDNGTLSISLLSKEEGLSLTISDNGCGFDQDSVRNGSFGMSLIDAFADRLGATYKIQSDNGTSANFHISKFKLAG